MSSLFCGPGTFLCSGQESRWGSTNLDPSQENRSRLTVGCHGATTVLPLPLLLIEHRTSEKSAVRWGRAVLPYTHITTDKVPDLVMPHFGARNVGQSSSGNTSAAVRGPASALGRSAFASTQVGVLFKFFFSTTHTCPMSARHALFRLVRFALRLRMARRCPALVLATGFTALTHAHVWINTDNKPALFSPWRLLLSSSSVSPSSFGIRDKLYSERGRMLSLWGATAMLKL